MAEGWCYSAAHLIYWDQTNFTENPSRSADFFEGADIYADSNAGLKVLVKASSVNTTKKESC